MAQRPPRCSPARSFLGATLVAVLPAAAWAQDLAVEAAAAFEKRDVAPRDGVLAGAEMAGVAVYDTDGDGRVTPEEFVRGYSVQKPAEARPGVVWRRHEFEEEGFSCEAPVAMKPVDSAGAARFQVVADVPQPRVHLAARIRDMPARAAGKPAPFFDTVVEQLEAAGAKVVDRRPANLGLHRGSRVTAEWQDGKTEIVRSVVVGRAVYELDATLPADSGAAQLEAAERFLGSLQLVR